MYTNLTKRENNSYFYTHPSGLPYGVVYDPEDKEWQDVDAWAKANPTKVTQEVPHVPSQEELNAQRVAVIDMELASLDQSQLVNSLRIKASELEGKDDVEGRTRFLDAEAKKEALRAERATLTAT